MKPAHVAFILVPFLSLVHSPSDARAGPVVIEAGKTHTLNDDLLLDGEDALQIHGTPEKPCILVCNRHRIFSGPKWTGSLKITHTTIHDLGGLPRDRKSTRLNSSH